MFRKVSFFTFLAAILGTLGIGVFQARGQDVVFGQFYANPLYLNPALAGNANGPRLTSNFRNQWPALNASFLTYSLGFDQYLPALRSGIGFHILTDQIGSEAYRSTQASLIYAFNLRLTQQISLRTGFQYTFLSKSLNFNKLIFPEQINSITGIGPRPPGSTLPFGSDGLKSVSISDLSAGLILFSDKFFVGGSIHHLTEPNQAFYLDSKVPLSMRISGHAGVNINLTPQYNDFENWVLSPNILYIQQGPARQINLGTYLSRGALAAGAWYRVNDALILTAGFQKGKMRLGYGYEITTSTLRAVGTGGSHEVSLGFIFENPEPIETIRYEQIRCPQF